MQSEERHGTSSFQLEEKNTLNTNESQYLLAGNGAQDGKISCTQDTASSQLPKHGTSVFVCALFIVGQMASSGILALPHAIANSGWSGVIMLFVYAIVTLYCGILIGKCWIQLRTTTFIEGAIPRDPYATIGNECYGRLGKVVVEFCLLASLIGAAAIMLLISAQNTASIVDRKIGSFRTSEGETRAWLLIISAFLLPFIYLEKLKDIWPFAVIAALTTSTACCLIICKCILDWPRNLAKVPQIEVTTESFFKAFGTVSFAYGGISLFPSYQTDMKMPEKFPFSAALGLAIVATIYAPTSILPFLVYGARNSPNALQTIKQSGRIGLGKNMALAAEILVTFHLICSFLIVLNPVSQQIEEYFKWPNRFGWRRCLLRTVIFLSILGIAEAVPHFDIIVSLIGGTTSAMMTYVFPCVFYLKLNPDLPLYIKILHLEIIIISLGSAIAVTYSSVLQFKKILL